MNDLSKISISKDPISAAMAEASLQPVVDENFEGCEVSLADAEAPLPVEEAFVQTDEELTGTRVVM